MWRNAYDLDITTWSPVGRLFQVEYAMEAVKQGSATIGLRSNEHAVLVSLKRSPHSELSSYQKKIFKVDDHMAVSIAGLTADGRLLLKFMRNECLSHKFVYESPIQASRLVSKVADKSQVCTQRAGKRPFGVGMLVIAHDKTGPHLFQTCPSGNFYDYYAVAIGARSQSAKTYLEDHFDSFHTASLEDLITHGLRALNATLGENVELTSKNCSVSFVGPNGNAVIFEDDDVEQFLKLVENDLNGSNAPSGEEPVSSSVASIDPAMDVD